jgi:ankyrin repeat protein
LAAEAGLTAALPYLVETSDSFWVARECQQDNERESFFQLMRDSINATDDSGNTALHHAARHGHEEFVAKLRLLGGSFIDIDLRNHRGLTALDLAKKNHHVWLVSALKGRVV